MTVALARVVASTSVTVIAASTKTAAESSTNAVVPAEVVTTGALLTATISTFRDATLLLSAPSFAWNVITRVVVSGAFEVFSYVTLRRTIW